MRLTHPFVSFSSSSCWWVVCLRKSDYTSAVVTFFPGTRWILKWHFICRIPSWSTKVSITAQKFTISMVSRTVRIVKPLGNSRWPYLEPHCILAGSLSSNFVRLLNSWTSGLCSVFISNFFLMLTSYCIALIQVVQVIVTNNATLPHQNISTSYTSVT